VLKLSKLNLSNFKEKNILLLTHENADLDAFTSAVILKQILNKNKVNASIGVPTHINEQTLDFAFKENVSFLVNPDLEQFDIIITLDFNDYEQLGALRKTFTKMQKKKCFKVFAIDHHQKEKRSIASGLIKPKYFSTTQILFDKFENNFNKKSYFYASIGMFEDTGRFIVGDKKLFNDFYKCLKKSGKKYSEVYAVAKHKIPKGEKLAFLKAIKRSEVKKINHFVLVKSEVDFYGGAAATKLLEFGADIALVFGTDKKGISKLSLRAETSFKDKNNFNLMKDVLIPLNKVIGGEVGGHSGAAQWKGKVNKKEVIKEVNKIIEKKLMKIKIKH
jgi:nanoRNase/pAp phosphatase (c-di-AMP/oligoRNAs hydrolase)